MTRFAAIHAPSLRTQLLEIARPELQGKPWVLGLRQEGLHARIMEVSAQAAVMGIEPGMHISELRRKFPQVVVVAPDPRLVSRFRRVLSAFCSARSGVWEVSDDGDSLLDLGGFSHLMGTEPSTWVAQLRADLKLATGVHNIRIVLAPSRACAEALARVSPESPYLLVTESEQEQLLGPVSLENVSWLGKSTRDQMERFRIRTLADIRRYPHAFLRQHFGETGERLSALARGLDTDAVGSFGQALAEEHLFRREESDHAALRACVHELADRLSFALRERGLASREVRLRVSWTDGQELSAIAHPLPSCATFMELRETAWKLLSELTIRRAPVGSMRLSASRTENVAIQEDLFGTVPSASREGLVLEGVSLAA